MNPSLENDLNKIQAIVSSAADALSKVHSEAQERLLKRHYENSAKWGLPIDTIKGSETPGSPILESSDAAYVKERRKYTPKGDLFQSSDWKHDKALLRELREAFKGIPQDLWVGVSEEDWNQSIIGIFEKLAQSGYCLIIQWPRYCLGDENKIWECHLSPLKTDGSVDFKLTFDLFEACREAHMIYDNFETLSLRKIAYLFMPVTIALANQGRFLIRKSDFDRIGESNFL